MRTFLILAGILFMAANLFPQRSIIIHKNDGSGDETILTSKIDSITFFTALPPSFQCGVSQVSYAGKNYNTIQIGTQCWLKENLDVGTLINDPVEQSNNGTIEKYCYNNSPDSCSKYGGLYQWAEAVQYQNGATNTTMANPQLTGNVQGICPTGWHIPTYAELQTLVTTVSNDGNALKQVGQDGYSNNTSGFSALLAGYRNVGGNFDGFHSITFFWSSTEYSASRASSIFLLASQSVIGFENGEYKECGFSVRCAKDF